MSSHTSCCDCKYLAIGGEEILCFINIPVPTQPKPQYSRAVYNIPVGDGAGKGCASYEEDVSEGDSCNGCLHFKRYKNNYYCQLISPSILLAMEEAMKCAHFMEKVNA